MHGTDRDFSLAREPCAKVLREPVALRYCGPSPRAAAGACRLVACLKNRSTFSEGFGAGRP